MLRTFPARRRARAPRRPAFFRPSLTTLEDRLAPGNTLLDGLFAGALLGSSRSLPEPVLHGISAPPIVYIC
jgi:hypothetical protein